MIVHEGESSSSNGAGSHRLEELDRFACIRPSHETADGNHGVRWAPGRISRKIVVPRIRKIGAAKDDLDDPARSRGLDESPPRARNLQELRPHGVALVVVDAGLKNQH